MKMNHKKTSGFTLAEILVTLGIIGVIASMTIPNLVQDIQDAQFKTAWKKAFSDFSQATMRLVTENVGSLKRICSDLDDNCLRDKYSSFLNYVKTCNRSATDGICWSDSDKSLTGVNSSIDSACAGFVLNNGSFLILRNENMTTCAQSGYRCGYMWVDVNGFKGPNVIGKDIYGASLRESTVIPWGQTDGFYCQGSSGGYAGAGCSSVYLSQ